MYHEYNPLGLRDDSGVEKDIKEQEELETENSVMPDLRQGLGKFARAAAMLGMLVATPALDNSVDAQDLSTKDVIEMLERSNDRQFHNDLESKRKLADSYTQEMRTLLDSEKDSLGEYVSVDMVKGLARLADNNYRTSLDGNSKYYLFEKMGTHDDLVAFKEILLEIKSSVIQVSEKYDIPNGPNKQIYVDSMDKFDNMLTALDVQIAK